MGRWAWVALSVVLVAAIAGVALFTTGFRIGSRDVGGRKRVFVGSGTVLVRVRIHVIDASGRPVADARVVASPLARAREEAVEAIRRSIQLSRASGEIAGDGWAIGTTDASGVASLEYTLSGAVEGGEGEWIPEGSFPFADHVRVDSVECGTIFRELDAPRNVRYDLNPGPIGRGSVGVVEWVAEADFEVRCDK